MDRLEQYRNIIIETFKKYSEAKPVNLPDIDVQVVIDKENDHYLLYHIGWNKLERVHDCVFHFDIINGKIWAQEDNTNSEIVTELVEKGVPKSDIVLGFHPAYKRKFTGYGV